MIGIITNVAAVFIGGILGSVFGSRLPDNLVKQLNKVFGICAMSMGISSITLMQNMPAVVLAMILGSSLGLIICLGDKIAAGGQAMGRAANRLLSGMSKAGMSPDEFESLLVTAIVLFCSSGTGIYGSLDAGMTGNVTVLMAKSVLDLFTAMIFACNLGIVTSFVALPQLIIFTMLFLLAGVIYPLTTPVMINDFKACGGFILVATGFRIAKIADFPIADMIPAMILVMPVSSIWTNFIVPLL